MCFDISILGGTMERAMCSVMCAVLKRRCWDIAARLPDFYCVQACGRRSFVLTDVLFPTCSSLEVPARSRSCSKQRGMSHAAQCGQWLSTSSGQWYGTQHIGMEYINEI